MKKVPGAGALFGKDVKSEFLRLTGTRYDSMVARMVKKKLPALNFTKDEFRAYVLEALGGNYDGAIRCRYCRKVCTLAEVTPDHEQPLSRGGSSNLLNLGFPCQDCNSRKGSLTPDEYLKLLAFLETIPLGRIDVLKRLQQSVKLAASARRMIMQVKGIPKKPAVIKQEDNLPPF
jgi:hypothetical protein